MIYEKLIIENFRGISHLELDDLKKINLIVGKNNTGKTSVLEALFLVSGISNPQLPFTLNILRGLNYLTHKEEQFVIYHKLNIDSTVKITAIRTNQKRCLEIKPHIVKTKGGIISTFEKELIGQKLISSTIDDSFVDGYVYEITILNHENNKEEKHYAEISPQGLMFQQKVPLNYNEVFNCTFITPSNILQQMPQGLNDIIINKKVDKIVEILSQIDSQIQGITVGINGLIYCDIGLDKMVPVNVMGDGIHRLLSLIVTVASLKNGVVLIDEIENGLHPETIYKMWLALITTAKEYNVQIFATTHSYECIELFRKATQADKHPKASEIARLFRVERKKDFTHIAAKYDEEMLISATEMNWEVR